MRQQKNKKMATPTYKSFCYIKAGNLKALFWFIKNGYRVKRYKYKDDSMSVTDDHYYRIGDKDGIWKSPKDFHNFLVKHGFLFKDYPSEGNWWEYFGVSSPTEYQLLRDHDWSTDLHDLRAQVESKFGF
jgi:hypothetical protein